VAAATRTKRVYHPPIMRIDRILADSRPVFSFEFFPPRDSEGVERLFETVAALKPLDPSFVSVTYGAGGATREGTVEIAAALQREHGLETMAHLSCVGETTQGLIQVLDRIGAAGIDNVLALRGDPPRGEPEFKRPDGGLSSAAELAAFISERYDFAIGGACFPEVHPEAPSLEADLAYLKTKVTSGASFLITQLFFDNRVYFDFVEAARAAGIEVPIIPGVIPIISYPQIVRFGGLCGASIPTPLAEAMEGMGGDAGAEAELGIAYAARQCEELLAGGAPGIHFYTLNRGRAARAVLAALHASRPWERRGGAPTAPQLALE
jgi:methylenetetrahydrofolate reductase (NADH)